MAAAILCITPKPKAVFLRPLGLRFISASRILSSGHNRWSKIKHDKVKEDAVRSKERSQWSRNIQEAVKKNGGDPVSNSELSTLVAQAKKAGLPKEIIERAIAKGKGVSLSGDALQTVTLQAMLPPSISTIIECQTDNKNRTLEDIRLIVKKLGGTVTPTSHLFERRGHVILGSERPLEEEGVMEAVLEAGALDMELHGDRKTLSVYTEPNQTTTVAHSLASSLGLTLRRNEIIWVARPESLVEVEAGTETQLRLKEIL
ncbi:MAG: hypothetical protein Q9181_005006, partial [Wetmoreana brouardii]